MKLNVIGVKQNWYSSLQLHFEMHSFRISLQIILLMMVQRLSFQWSEVTEKYIKAQPKNCTLFAMQHIANTLLEIIKRIMVFCLFH